MARIQPSQGVAQSWPFILLTWPPVSTGSWVGEHSGGRGFPSSVIRGPALGVCWVALRLALLWPGACLVGPCGGTEGLEFCPVWGSCVKAWDLEHRLCIENLPCELQRNFQLMRELDQRTEDKKAEIDILAAEYIATVKTLSPDQRVEHLQKIQSAYSKCKEYSDDKVQLAMQTYEMVDKHIRRLDADLARFEADLKDKMEGSDFESSGGRGLKKGRGQKEKRGSRGRGRRTSEEDTPKKKKHKGGSEFSDTVLSVHPSDVLDMPVDPNEPTYCLCHQVSYGEMIGCDNPDCPIEWFHFACVDLTTKPKGKWFCPRCVQERRKKK
uniref:Inhibitor of growth protein n=1 Tax=Sus scrofa TaxID=9823 RepID=A0A8D0Q5P7_PIG